MMEDALERIKKFHAHLDGCKRCRNQCFNLCQVGAKLLKYAATGEIDEGEIDMQHKSASGNIET